MSNAIKLECIDPTQTFTKGGVYIVKRFMSKKGNIISHGVQMEEATHVLVKNDNENIMKATIDRFKLHE